MSIRDPAELARIQQDEIAAETGFDQPYFDDDGRPLEDVTKREPEVVKKRRKPGAGAPLGCIHKDRKDGVKMTLIMARDCYEYAQFLVENGNAMSLTEAVEVCIRGDREAQRIPEKEKNQ